MFSFVKEEEKQTPVDKEPANCLNRVQHLQSSLHHPLLKG